MKAQQAESWSYWGEAEKEQPQQCAALDPHEVQCSNTGVEKISYHGDAEIYRHRDARPIWVHVWVCKDHRG
jgi:hypothetical protein